MKLRKKPAARQPLGPISRETQVPPYFFPVLLALVSFAFFALIADFYKAITWAFVFALLATPLCDRIVERFRLPRAFAAGLTTAAVILVVVIPAVAFGWVIAGQASGLVDGIQAGEIDPAAPIRWLVEIVPRFEAAADRFGLDIDNLSERISEGFIAGGEFMASKALLIGQGALKTGLLLVLAVYLLFFFLYDGRRIMNFIYEAFPVEGSGESYLFQEIGKTTQATVKGILVIGIAQGTVGGIAFALLGFSNALLWGVAMAISTIIPAVGTAIVWVPAAIVLFAAGELTKGVLMLIVGALVIGTIDNLLRPRIVGAGTRMPDYVVLLATLGGIGAFGITGIVLGPVIAAMFLSCWRLYRPQVSIDEIDDAPPDATSAD
jgi:predicted PurR-regulated permease PerM